MLVVLPLMVCWLYSPFLPAAGFHGWSTSHHRGEDSPEPLPAWSCRFEVGGRFPWKLDEVAASPGQIHFLNFLVLKATELIIQDGIVIADLRISRTIPDGFWGAARYNRIGDKGAIHLAKSIKAGSGQFVGQTSYCGRFLMW